MGGDSTWEVLDSIADCSDEELDAKIPVDSTTAKTRCSSKVTTKKKKGISVVSRDSGSEEDETMQLTDADLMETSKQQDPSQTLPEHHPLSEPSMQVGSAKESTATEKRTNGSSSARGSRRGKRKGVAAAEPSSAASTVRTSKRKTRGRGK